MMLAAMLQSQHLSAPAATHEEYIKLFRDLSPVPTPYWCAPGSPPQLLRRCAFDDYAYNTKNRAERVIIKGRFQSGNIGYVHIDDLPLYMAVYRRTTPPTRAMEEMLSLLDREGPMPISIIKEMTGGKVKEITPLLHKLQEMFLVFEDQTDNEGDRAWYVFRKEFADLPPVPEYEEALIEIVKRWLSRLVWADIDMLKGCLTVPRKALQAAVLADGIVASDGGYMLETLPKADHPRSGVWVLQRNDPLVRAYSKQLTAYSTKSLTGERDILQYVLVDGVFRGIVIGKYHNGPHEVDAMLLDLSSEEIADRKSELQQALWQVYPVGDIPLHAVTF